MRTLKGLKALALALLALLLLASAPAAQLVQLAEAQGAGAKGAGGGGVIESRGALYVYKDLSASLELHTTQKLEEPVVESWSLSALLDIEPAGTAGTADTATFTISALSKRPILHPEELEWSYGGINYYKISCERSLEGEVGNATTIVFRVRLYNETDEVSLFIFLTDKRAVGPACLWEGTIAYTFSKAFAEAWKDFFEEVNLTDETSTKYFVKAHFYSHITGWGATIDVEVLNATKTENQIRVDFRIFMDKERLVKGLATWFGRELGVHGLPEPELKPERELSTNESIAFFDGLFSPPRAGSLSFSLTGFHNATLYDLKGNVKAPRENLSRALILTSMFTEMWWRYAHATRFELDPWRLLGVFTIVLQDVEVKSGGELHVSLEEMKGVIPTTLFKVDLKTPKIVKKGATTPAETLKALFNMTAILFLRSPVLDNTTLSVFPDEWVKVKLNGAEVKEVAFKDLGSLKVTLATALTVSVEPSTIEVGREVVVRGKIEPAMSASITISVVAPDGSVKTIDVTAGEDGSFSASIRLEKAGSYTITASYTSSELYEPSTASTDVEVKAPPAPLLVPEALWYVIAIVVVVVGIIIAVIKAPQSARRP
jgi:hypothetical protein